MTLAYILKLAGLFSKEDKKTLSNLIFYVTLPASLISGFTDAKVNIYYVVAILTGFGVNTVMVIAGQIASRNKSRELQAIYAVNASGYNMACIAIPFLSNFYPGGVPYLCMFDVGDSFYTLGTIYALAQVRLNQGNKSEKCNINLLYIIKSLFSSVPFVVYFTMTVLSFLNFHLPSVIVEIADFCGHGNGFLAMMMIGISLEINMSRDTFREVIHLLALRYAIGIVSAILIFCILHEADISGSSILIKCGSIYNIFRKIRSANRYSSSTQSNLYNMYDTSYGYCYNANNVGMVLTE